MTDNLDDTLICGICNEKIDISPCDSILKTGKNKGNPCNKNCELGYFKCKRHKNQ